jgi:xanthine dehydrogenase accessory factor
MSLSLAATMSLVEELRRRQEEFCLVTVIRTANATSAKAGAKAVVTGDGALHGFVGGGCVRGAATRAALAAMAAGEPRMIRVRPKDELGSDTQGLELHDSHCPSGGTIDLFLEPMLQRTRIVICGASPVAATLARLGHSMGYEMVAAAPAADLARLAEADRRIEGFDLSAVALRAQDAVVVATQGRGDRTALRAALLSPAGYVGMVGSRAKIGKLLEQLAREVPEELRRRLHGPAGIDIGAIDPEEIALSILSEIVRERRQSQRSMNAECAGAGSSAE